MQINLYINTDDNKTFPKTPILVATLNGNVRGEINVYNPTIRIETQYPISFNYVYIPDFNRYYYVVNSIVPCANIIDVTLKCDVLQSHYSEFVQCPVIVERSANKFNVYLPDNKRKFYQYTEPQYITIGEFSPPSSVIIVTVG